MENHGVDPDIEVVHSPADFFAAEDKQLDRAIAEAFEALDCRPAAEAPKLPTPKVRVALIELTLVCAEEGPPMLSRRRPPSR